MNDDGAERLIDLYPGLHDPRGPQEMRERDETAPVFGGEDFEAGCLRKFAGRMVRGAGAEISGSKNRARWRSIEAVMSALQVLQTSWARRTSRRGSLRRIISKSSFVPRTLVVADIVNSE